MDSLGNINLDYLALALDSTNAVPGLKLSSASLTGGVTLDFEPIPGLTYSVEWNASLLNPTAWQSIMNFISTGSTVRLGSKSSSAAGFLRIKAQP